MLIPKALLKICSTDVTRYAVGHIYVDVENRCAIATDGHKLVYYPIEPDLEAGEVSGFVPIDAVKAAATQKGAFCGLLLHREKETVVPCKGTFPNPFADVETPPTYPDWESIIAYPEENYHHISFNARYLADIADVVSPLHHAVTLHYNPDKPMAPLHVTTTESSAIAVLMPYRMS